MNQKFRGDSSLGRILQIYAILNEASVWVSGSKIIKFKLNKALFWTIDSQIQLKRLYLTIGCDQDKEKEY